MTTLKRMITSAILCMGTAFGAVADTNFEVKNVEAHQRYPWNGKVDIDFFIESSDADAEFKVTVVCTDQIGNTNLTLRTIKYNDKGEAATAFTLKPGRHRLTWDADVDLPNVKLPRISFSVLANLTGETDTAEYLVIDLSEGVEATAYPVSTRTGVPEGGWTDEYKSTKLVLRRCPAGADLLGRYTLTKDFYAGVFEVTEKQWELVMGENPSSYKRGDTYPVERVSYNDIRGEADGSNWPSSSAVDATSFLGKLRAKTGLPELDLPTEAQWEYTCRAGTTTTYNTGDSESALAQAGWYSGNSNNQKHPVGEKVANAWGLYDLHGNVWEWCLDWYRDDLSGTDPVGAASGSDRNNRGGGWNHGADRAASSYRYYSWSPSLRDYDFGFRLFRTVP